MKLLSRCRSPVGMKVFPSGDRPISGDYRDNCNLQERLAVGAATDDGTDFFVMFHYPKNGKKYMAGTVRTGESSTKRTAMSGRLTLLPKKTYCPWKPENVERVLRDERLERERQQAVAARSLGDEDDARRRRRRYDEGGHINLFPEAKDAEIRFITGGRGNEKQSKPSSSSVAAEALPPAPLGGDEAAKRKSGNVPFYMRQSSESRGKYDNINGPLFRLGDNRATGVRGDEITGKIMKDQFAGREDDRKDKMDPMSRFYIDSSDPSCNNSKGIVANLGANSTTISCNGDINKSQTETTNDNNVLRRHLKLPRDERTGYNHKSKRRRRRDDLSAESSFSSVSSSCASSADSAHKRRKRSSGRHKKRHKSRSHREEGSLSRSEDERRHRRNRSSEQKDGDESRSRRHRHRHKHKSHGKM